MAPRRRRPQQVEPGRGPDRRRQGGPHGRVAQRAGGPGRRPGRAGRGHHGRGREHHLQRHRQPGQRATAGTPPTAPSRTTAPRASPATSCRRTWRLPAGPAKVVRENPPASSSATRRSARAVARRPPGSLPIRSSRGRSRTTARSRPVAPPAAARKAAKGSEGLQGPKPSGKGPRDLNRLAGKQAALRNKAEGVDVQFAVTNFHHTDMKKMLDIMQQVEIDLKAGNYQNVLRQRKALLRAVQQCQTVFEGRVPGPQGHDHEPARPDPEGHSRRHARPIPDRLGGTQPAVFRAAGQRRQPGRRRQGPRRRAAEEVIALRYVGGSPGNGDWCTLPGRRSCLPGLIWVRAKLAFGGSKRS